VAFDAHSVSGRIDVLLKVTVMIRIKNLLKITKKESPRLFPRTSLKIIKTVYDGLNFAAPNPDVTATIHDSQDNLVGKVKYTISPLNDRIYLFEIKIDPLLRRRGLGLATLIRLAETYDLPITVIHPISSALLFWETARKELSNNILITESISSSEMDTEKARWSHLQPEVEKLKKAIEERFARGESHEQAVGRGVDK
jgi:hypothetical protein